MKKILFATFFILAICNFAFSQNKLPELEKVRKVKVFESNQKDVKKILSKYIDEDYDVEDYEQRLLTENSSILVTFSSGNCADDSAYWNITKGLVTSIAISPRIEIKIKDINFDLSNFKKEVEDKGYPDQYEYRNEKSGILVKMDNDEIEEIVFYPPIRKNGFLCINENTSKIISGEERFVDTIFSYICVLINLPPIINEITFSDSEVFANGKDKELKVSVSVSASDPENDVLTYNYKVSAGKIIGQGASVIWDLTNVEKGTHTITATIDDGCGDCAVPMTKTVFIK